MTAGLASAARRELAAREKHWPAKVAAGEMAQANASADIAAWRAIAALLDHGEAETDLGWPALAATAETAVERRLAACVANPSPDNERRLGDVHAIRRTILRSAIRCAGLAALQPAHERLAA